MVVTALCLSSQAADDVKANNTTSLTSTGSWVDGSLPTILKLDVATWNSTVTGANTVAIGGNLDVLGIKIVDPGGAVAITNTTGNVLTIGSSGIDMSAATQNLSLFANTTGAAAGNIDISANQIWNVAASRTLTLLNNSNSLNSRLTGSGNIEVTGGGIVRVLTGDAGSTTFASGNGNDTYSGNWTITNGSVRGLRNGTHAWGTGTIYMNGGTIGQEQGNWTWTNNIVLNSSTSSTINDFNTNNSRTLKLQGVISGSGNVTFAETGGGNHAVDGGYILTGANTMSGIVTINSPAVLRIGGVGGNDTTTGAGSTGTLGTATIVNNGTVTLSRNNTWTFANDMSGTGVLRVGLTTGDANHIVTVSGNNNHSGGTRLQAAATLKIGSANALGTGAFTIGGNSIFDNATGSALALNNAFALSGGNPTFAGTHDMTINGAVTLSGANRTITTSAGNLTLGGNISGAFGLTKEGAGTLTLNGNGTHNATSVNAGTLVLGNATNTLPDTQAVTISGGTLSIGSNNDIVGAVTLTSGSITGSTGILTGASYSVSAGTISAILGGSGALTKSTAGTVTLSGANTYTGNTTVSAGTLYINGSLGNSAVIVDAGAKLGGTGTVAGSLNFAGTAVLEVVDWNNPLAVAGTISFGSGFGIGQLSGFDWDSLALGTHTLLSTNQIFSSTDLNHFGYVNRLAVGNQGREAYFTNGSLAVVVIPESSVAFLGSFGALLLLRRHRVK